MEVLWNFDGGIMESLWKFHRENPRLEYGETMEHLWKIATVEHLWRFDTLENCKLENTKDTIQWSSTRTNRRDGKMFRKIADWASTESGKEVLTGIICGAVGIFAVRVFMFVCCVATGYPANPWNILFWL